MWQIISSVCSGLALIVSSAMFVAIKFNDVKHIQIAVEKIEKAVAEIQRNDELLKITATKIETRCQERHRRKIK